MWQISKCCPTKIRCGKNYGFASAFLVFASLPPLVLRCSGDRLRVLRSNSLATVNGWFDLQAGQKDFGDLPYEDQELLAGMEPTGIDPMAALRYE